MKISFYLKILAKNKYMIFAWYRRQNIMIKRTTNIDLPSQKVWDNQKQRVRNMIEVVNRDTINTYLQKVQDRFKHYYIQIENEPTKETITEALERALYGKKEDTSKKLFNYLNKFIENVKKRKNTTTGLPINKKTIERFVQLKEKLEQYKKEYKKDLDFKDIDVSFYRGFIALLEKQGYKINTIGGIIKKLKEFLNQATKDGYNTYTYYKDKEFKAFAVEVDSIYLTEAELQKLFDVQLPNERLDNVRKLFLIGCYTGLRFQNYSDLPKGKIQNDILTIKQAKTGQMVSVPIPNKIKPLIADPNIKPISNEKFNQYIKEVGLIAGIDNIVTHESKEVPKYNLISSHTARRTYATLSYLKGIEAKTIMAITGHRTEASFYKYIKLNQLQHINKAKEVWDR